MRSTLIALALLAAPTARAISPETDVHIGIEPHRVYRDHAAVQARLATSPEFQRFVDEHPDWQARFDEVTGAPRMLWGGPIPVPTDSPQAVANAVRDLLDRHAELLNYRAGTLQVVQANYVDRTDTWYVDFSAPRDGVGIWRGGLTARVKHGNLVMIGALAYGDRPTSGTWSLGPQQAIDAAIEGGPAPFSKHLDTSAERIWLPVEGPTGLRLVATWLVRSRTTDIPGQWVSFVDADDGGLINVHNEVRFFDGTVTALHAERTLDGSPLVSSPVPLAFVSDGVDIDTTDAAGDFSIPGTAAVTTDFDGEYLEVVNTDGSEAVLSGFGPLLEWTTANATQAEISTYVFLHQIQAWGQRVAPEVGVFSGPIRSNVNITNASCNAYFDGEVNFYAAADGCANTGEIADVNYHEWGHGFHLWSLESGWQAFDGSLSEGAADTVAFLQTEDSRIAPYFFNSGGSIRDVSPNRVYPEDYQDSEYAVHSNGLIFGGAMWDLWHMLMDAEGVDVGTASTEEIFAGLLKGGPGVAESYDEAILADDDDGNLANGTPHECEIIEAFGQHGLGPLGGGGGVYVATHQPARVHTDANQAYPVVVDVRSSAPNCFSVDPIGGTVHFRVDGGDWQTADLTMSGTEAIGEIEAQDFGSIVEYWVQVDDSSGETVRLPEGGDINPHSFYVGPVLEVVCNDFESGRGKYDHELVSGEETEGADDWQWGAPAGKGGDPAAAYSGDNLWGNDLGWDNFNGEYQSDKKNRLYTPELETHHYEGVFLQYQRWLTIEDGVWDRGRISADDQVVWSNVKGAPDVGGKDHVDMDWSPQAIALDGLADDGSVVLDWTLTSDGGVTMGGWNIDDVCLLAPDTPNNRLGINGIAGIRKSDSAIEVSWTNPFHDPVQQVFVVRSLVGPPQSAKDGDRVWSTKDVELGKIAGMIDDEATEWDTWYAVYATDGTDTLGWTREGFNVVFVAGEGRAPDSVINGKGCGCSSTGTSGTWAGLFALLGLVGLRRRR